MIETGFGKEFSEPPNVTVSAARTHCEACQEPLDPNVMHKCHGNKHFEPRAVSHAHITEACPECDTGEGVLITAHVVQGQAFSVVCKACRTYLWPLVTDKGEAIASWNTAAATHKKGCWPRWLAGLPGDDEHSPVMQTFTSGESHGGYVGVDYRSHPDLSSYKGACPAVHVEGEVCDWCENTGTIPPTKEDAQ